MTLPLSVLQLQAADPAAVHFEPPLTDKRAALAGLALGPVIKVLLRFRRAFWEQMQRGRFNHTGFMHAAEAPFPTVWTALPFRVPLLTAWMGGPRAQRMAGVSRDVLIEQALKSIQHMLGADAPVLDEFVAAYVHDWGDDPHARGAYCYARVGGSRAHEQLAQPLRDTLFFAGEATDGDHTGTVEGALQSGHRAAHAVIAALAQ